MNGAASGTNHRMVIDYLDSVQYDCDVTIDESEIAGLPLALVFPGINRRCNAATDRADAQDPLHPAIAIDDLRFVMPRKQTPLWRSSLMRNSMCSHKSADAASALRWAWDPVALSFDLGVVLTDNPL